MTISAHGRDTARFINLVTLQEAFFTRTLVPASGCLYWRQEGTEALLTESQLTVSRWHDPVRYGNREDLLRASVKWTMKAARRASGENRSTFVRDARERHHEVVGMVRARREAHKARVDRYNAIKTLRLTRDGALKEAREASGGCMLRHHADVAKLLHRAMMVLKRMNRR